MKEHITPLEGLLPSGSVLRRMGLAAAMMVSATTLLSPEVSHADVREFWRAVDIAQSHNPSIHKAEAQLRIAREDESQTFAKLIPSADFTASHSIQGTHYRRLGTQKHSNPSKIELNIDQVIFNVPDFMEYSQSDLVRETAYAELMAMRQDMVLQVSSVAANWLEAKQVFDLANKYLKVTRKNMKVVKLRLDSGEANETEFNEAASRSAQAEASYEDALNTVKKEAEFFKEIVGQYPDDSLSLPELSWSEPENLDEQIWRWIEDRPDIWAARSRLKEREYDVSIARSQHLPTLDVNYSASRTWDSELGGTSGISLTDTEDAHQLLFTFNLPLFSGGETVSKSREAMARKASSLADLDRAKKLAWREVEEARHDLKNNQTAIVALEKALLYSNKALAGLEEEYLAGTRTLVDLLDTRFDLFTLESTLVRHRFQAQLALVSLWRALGRSVVPESTVPVGDHEEVVRLAHVGREAVIEEVVEKERAILIEKIEAVQKIDDDVISEGLNLVLSALLIERGIPLHDPPLYGDQRRPLKELNDDYWLSGKGETLDDDYILTALIPREERPAEVPLSPMIHAKGEYMIHMETYVKEEDIAPMIYNLSQEGIPTWLEIMNTPDGKEMTRVVAGPFKRYEDVQEKLDRIQRRLGLEAGWVPHKKWQKRRLYWDTVDHAKNSNHRFNHDQFERLHDYKHERIWYDYD
ncbi:MAG: TolC family protein [Magnetococcales bacterium]|nr:TolC family protein [Magnetococcales bacterium]